MRKNYLAAMLAASLVVSNIAYTIPTYAVEGETTEVSNEESNSTASGNTDSTDSSSGGTEGNENTGTSDTNSTDSTNNNTDNNQEDNSEVTDANNDEAGSNGGVEDNKEPDTNNNLETSEPTEDSNDGRLDGGSTENNTSNNTENKTEETVEKEKVTSVKEEKIIDEADKIHGSNITLKVASSSDVTPPDGGDGGGDVPPDIQPETFSVTVPATIPISMDLDGNIKVPDTLEIVNGNDSAIKCIDIELMLDAEWTAVNFDDLDINTAPVDSKDFSIAFRGDKLQSDGLIGVTEKNWNFGANSSLPLNTKVRLPKQSTEYEADLATVNFTFDWSDKTESSAETIGSEIPDQTVKTDKIKVTLVVPEGVTFTGDTIIEVEAGKEFTLPQITVSDISKEVDQWINADTKEPITVTDGKITVSESISLTVTLKNREASPEEWFTVNGNNLTGFSSKYKSLIEKPTDIIIPSTINGVEIISIGDLAFKNSRDFSRLVIPDSITNIGEYAFENTGLTQLSIPDSVTAIGKYAFIYSSIESIDIGNSITTLATGTFYECRQLKSVNLSQKLNSIGECAFYFCDNLNTISLPDSLQTIGHNSFAKCIALDNLIIPDSVTSIDSAAFTSVPQITYDGPVGTSTDTWGALKRNSKYTQASYFSVSADGTLTGFSDEYASLGDNAPTDLVIPNTVNGIRVTKIGDSAFIGNNITSVIIPDTVTKIGVDAFSGNKKLISVDIPNSVTILDACSFNNCDSLEFISIPESVTSIGFAAFANCDKLKSVTLPESLTTLGTTIFSHCSLLETINIPKSIARIPQNTFEYCNKLKITIPDSVTAIGTDAFLNVPEVKYSGPAAGRPWGAYSVVPNN